MTCSVDGCDRPIHGLGLCSKHYQRLKKYGDPLKSRPYVDRGSLRRFVEAILSGPSEGNGCLYWPFPLVPEHYPQIRINGVNHSVHVLICEHFNGPRPKGQDTRHECGDRRCVAPWHLSWSTHLVNMQDRIKHGTSNRGERNPQWSGALTESQVREIIAALGTERQCDISRRFGVDRRIINDIARGRKWAWVATEGDQ